MSRARAARHAAFPPGDVEVVRRARVDSEDVREAILEVEELYPRARTRRPRASSRGCRAPRTSARSRRDERYASSGSSPSFTTASYAHSTALRSRIVSSSRRSVAATVLGRRGGATVTFLAPRPTTLATRAATRRAGISTTAGRSRRRVGDARRRAGRSSRRSCTASGNRRSC